MQNALHTLKGDSGYAYLPWLMTPLEIAPHGTPASSYNKLHAQCRNPVERCIGVLKARWRCMTLPIHYVPGKAGKIINACAVLHNILLEERVPIPVDHELFMDAHENYFVDPDELRMLPAELRRQADANRQYLVEHAHWYLNRDS
ncbi:hypothetical protein FOCC_FOCC015309 [Frankliniella occidentalis]|nr:hypothetical protein FOCC_FOCC015309 [Frankliniella occidentalis]